MSVRFFVNKFMRLRRFGLKRVFIFLIGIVSLAFVFLLAKPNPIYADVHDDIYCPEYPCEGQVNIENTSWTEPDHNESYDSGDSVTFTSSYNVSLSGGVANMAA